METFAIHKGAIIKPRLARMTMDLIRGKDVNSARAILNTTNTKASVMILKVLNSAVANAVNNNGCKEDELVIKECFINPGTTIKRIHFASRGNVDRHDKRTSHIKIVVTDNKKGENA